MLKTVCANAWVFKDHKVVKPMGLETQTEKSGLDGPLRLLTNPWPWLGVCDSLGYVETS
jgi:hypothetical protein